MARLARGWLWVGLLVLVFGAGCGVRQQQTDAGLEFSHKLGGALATLVGGLGFLAIGGYMFTLGSWKRRASWAGIGGGGYLAIVYAPYLLTSSLVVTERGFEAHSGPFFARQSVNVDFAKLDHVETEEKEVRTKRGTSKRQTVIFVNRDGSKQEYKTEELLATAWDTVIEPRWNRVKSGGGKTAPAASKSTKSPASSRTTPPSRTAGAASRPTASRPTASRPAAPLATAPLATAPPTAPRSTPSGRTLPQTAQPSTPDARTPPGTPPGMPPFVGRPPFPGMPPAGFSPPPGGQVTESFTTAERKDYTVESLVADLESQKFPEVFSALNYLEFDAASPLDPKVLKALEAAATRGRDMDRSSALQLLARFGSAENGPAIIQALGDSNTFVRDAAREAVAKLKLVAGLDPMATAIMQYNDFVSIEERFIAFGAAAEPAAMRLVEHGSDHVRRDGFKILEIIGTPTCLPAMVKLEFENDDDWFDQSRAKAVIESVQRRYNIADADLPKLPFDLELAVTQIKSLEAQDLVRALERLKRSAPRPFDPKLVEALKWALLESEDRSVNLAVRRFLVKDASPEVIPILNAILSSTRDSFDKDDVIRVFTKVKLRESIAPMVKLVGKGSMHDWMLIDALVFQGPDAEPEVIKLLTNQNSSARRAACKILEQIGGSRSIAPLTRLSKDVSAKYEAQSAVAAIQTRIKEGSKPK